MGGWARPGPLVIAHSRSSWSPLFWLRTAAPQAVGLTSWAYRLNKAGGPETEFAIKLAP